MRPSLAGWHRTLALAGITVGAACLFLFLRQDLLLLAEGQYWKSVQSPRIISAYLSTPGIHKLQIGAGSSRKSGWLNTDIEKRDGLAFLDATKPFPLPDGSVRAVFSEHVIEHLTFDEGRFMLKECHRVLAPGGRIRIATPNLLKFTRLLQVDLPDDVRRFEGRKLQWHKWPQTVDPGCFILNMQLREWGHQFIYTPKMLRGRLEKFGFTDVREFKPGISDDPELADMEARSEWNFRDVNAEETMILQAVRR